MTPSEPEPGHTLFVPLIPSTDVWLIGHVTEIYWIDLSLVAPSVSFVLPAGARLLPEGSLLNRSGVASGWRLIRKGMVHWLATPSSAHWPAGLFRRVVDALADLLVADIFTDPLGHADTTEQAT